MPRFIQVFLSFILLIISSPLWLVISFSLIFSGPVLFRQQRIGKDNKPFTLYKFRTMKPVRQGSDSSDLHGTERITRIGKSLRKFSLDELPQLWNILLGDMNIIGPRPLPVEYLHRMSSEIKKRHLVYPGITGWAQVNGRNALSWEEKFGMDTWYVSHRSFRLDLRILIKTLPMIVTKKGVDQNEFQTMEEFKGDGSRKADAVRNNA